MLQHKHLLDIKFQVTSPNFKIKTDCSTIGVKLTEKNRSSISIRNITLDVSQNFIFLLESSEAASVKLTTGRVGCQ